MARILLILFLLFAGWYIWQYLKSLPPAKRGKLMRSWGLLALVVISLLLVALGKLHWVAAAIAAAIPVLRVLLHYLSRALPLLQFWHRHQGKPSVIRTRGLEVSFNFATGEMDGLLREGPYKGQSLNSLDESKLNEQFAYFQSSDRQSALLLRAYLLRRGFSGYQASGKQQDGQQSDRLSREEALQILGLEPGATQEEIVRAHRRLIQKLHPDRGGNDYLAAKINGAKATLIEK